MSRRATSSSVFPRFRASQVAVCLSLAFGVSAAHADNPYVAEVTGTGSNVNVRSGPSTNFYPVLRLAPGDRVTVIGEESGWYAIVPPEGCYSLISKHYVDVGANGEGVVNGNAVRVRAGSAIDDHRYAVQRKLDKGAVVRIVGEEGDSFLKIAPPEGARLWVSSDYVVRVPDDRLALANTMPAPKVTTPTTTAPKSTQTPPAPKREEIQQMVVTREIPVKIVEPAKPVETTQVAMNTVDDDDDTEVVIPDDAADDGKMPEETADTAVEIISPLYAKSQDNGETKSADSVKAEELSPIEMTMIPVPDEPEATEVAKAPSFLPERTERAEPMAFTGNTQPVAIEPDRTMESSRLTDTARRDMIASSTPEQSITTPDRGTMEITEATTPTQTEIIEYTDATSTNTYADTYTEPAIETAPMYQEEEVAHVDYLAGDQRENLNTLDSNFNAEMIKPVEDRRLVEIAEGYRQLAESGDDRLVKAYADRRLAQVELAIATADAIRDIHSLTNNVARDRRSALEERTQIRPEPQMVTRGFDAKGELRTSMIFESPAGPKRYRLVDPAMVVPRTLCYVEVPAELNLNMDEYVGRLVGIRASRKYLETGNVDPINVIVAEEFVVLDRSGTKAATRAPASSGATEMMAVVDVDTID